MTQQAGDPELSFRPAEVRDAPWQSGLARPLLIALQVTCLIAGPLAVIQAISGDSRLAMVPILAFLAALGGVYSANWLRLPEQRPLSKGMFQLAELVVLLVVLRLATWALSGRWPDLALARGWILAPWTFFDGYYLVAFILGALAWHRGGVVAAIFQQLALSPGELTWSAERAAGGWWRFARPTERAQLSRQELLRDYVSQWLFGGVLLVICAGMTRVRIDRQLGVSLLGTGVPTSLIAAIVLYFLIGLILTSQARLALLRAQWLFDGVAMPPRLPGRWHRFSLLIVLAIGLLATLLPLGSTWRMGEILNIVLGVVVQVVVTLILLLITLWALILSLLQPNALPPEIPPALTVAAQMPPTLPVLNVPPWLGGTVFWVAVLAILAYLLRYFLGKQGIDLTPASLRRAGVRLLARLRAWWASLRETVGLTGLRLPGQPPLGATPSQLRTPWRFVRIGGLPPREQVRYFYLSTVRRAGQQGVPRQPSQTPREYLADLETNWPEAELDVDALTEAFITARYDAVEIDVDDAKEAESVWKRIKRALRTVTHPGGRDSRELR